MSAVNIDDIDDSPGCVFVAIQWTSVASSSAWQHDTGRTSSGRCWWLINRQTSHTPVTSACCRHWCRRRHPWRHLHQVCIHVISQLYCFSSWVFCML